MATALIISPFSPNRATGGSATRLANVVEHLHGLGIEVDLLHVSRRPECLDALPVVRNCVRSVRGLCLNDRILSGVIPRVIQTASRPPSSLALRWLQRGLRMLCPVPSVDEEIAQHISRLRPDIVWLDHTWLAALVKRVHRTAGALWIVDTHDVMYRRSESRREAGLPPDDELSRDDETELLRPFDLVVAIQEDERRILAEMLPHHRVITLGHSHDVRPQSASEPTVCFVGSKIDENIHGLLAFIEQAWPEIAARCPRAQLEIVGSVCRSSIIRRAAGEASSRIVLRGRVERTEDIYNGPAVLICPLWAGSGLKIKVVEALAHGKATVATPVGAQGIEDGVNRAFALARTAAEFVEPVARMLVEPNYRHGWEAAAAEYSRRRFAPVASWRAIDAELAVWLGRRDESPSALPAYELQTA